MRNVIFVFAFVLIAVGGCQSLPQNDKAKSKESAKDAQAAVGAVVDTVSGQNRTVKYCPLCGRHYSGGLQECLEDGTALKTVEE